MNQQQLSRLILLIAFLEGSSLMAIELLSSKIIAPYYGNSLYVWTSVFTNTIAGLTLGYFIGGQLSKKNQLRKILVIILSFSLLFLVLVFPNSASISDLSFLFPLKMGAIIFSFILIFPIVFCLGLISPILIKLLSTSLVEIGSKSGKIYSISTLGGVIMTFLFGLYVIPNLGILVSIILISSLIGLALVLSLWIFKSSDKTKVKENEKQQLKTTLAVEKPSFNLFIYSLAFIEGSMVIAIELLGSKMIQPFLGNSLVIWTIVIGCTISFLTIGYYVGGELSKKQTQEKWIGLGFSLAAIFFVFMPITSIYLFEQNIEGALIKNSILITSLLIGPPLFFLGLTSPIIIQKLTKNVADAGKNAGIVYALSSVGGIIMTLLLGMFLLETYGLVKPLYVLSILLILAGISYYRSFFQFVLLVVFALSFLVVNSKMNETTWEAKNIKIRYVSEGLLGQLKIYDEYFPIEELEYRFLLINGITQTMIVNNNVGVSAWNYVHRISRIASLNKGGKALLLGLGGGSIASELNKLHYQTDVVDIDKRMFEICKKYFYYQDSNSTFYNDDARHYIRKCPKKYDLIVLDLLNGEVQPSNVFSKEGLEELSQLLNKNGIIIVNYQELVTGGKISAHHSICNTFMSLGMKVQYHYKNDDTDVVLVISKKELNLDSIPIQHLSPSFAYLGVVQALVTEPFTKVNKPFNDGMILTDNQPILDLLNAATIQDWRKNVIATTSKKQLELKLPIYH